MKSRLLAKFSVSFIFLPRRLPNNEQDEPVTLGEDDRKRLQYLQNWLRECKHIGCDGVESMSPERFDEFWNSLVWDTVIYEKDTNDKQLAKFAKYLEYMEASLDPHDEDWWARMAYVSSDVEKHFVRFSANRRFCCTLNGRLGSMPKGAEVGDKICVLYGGSLPYVIRGCGNGRYRFIGDCYVHGVMYGEAMNMDIKTEGFALI